LLQDMVSTESSIATTADVDRLHTFLYMIGFGRGMSMCRSNIDILLYPAAGQLIFM
jgi:hypothetical protein